MLDLLQTMSTACRDLDPIVNLIKKGLFPIIQMGVPILLIVMGSIDLGKAVLSSDDKEIKGATSKLIKRAIAAVAVFFVVTLVSVIMNMVSDSDNDISDDAVSWKKCWSSIK